MTTKTISIIGGLDDDLIMIANRIPDGESLLANEYLEALGGKGANSAIATYRTCHKQPDAHKTPATDILEQPGDGEPARQYLHLQSAKMSNKSSRSMCA